MLVKNPRINNFPPESTRMTMEKHIAFRKAFTEVIEDLTSVHHNLMVLDDYAPFFSESGHLRIYNDSPLYRDEDHVTAKGARELLSPTWQPLIEAAKVK